MSSHSSDKSLKKYLPIKAFVPFLITIIVVLISLKTGTYSPFGSKDILTAGKNSNELIYYYDLYDRVHSSDSLNYTTISGNYIDEYSTFLYHISDPTNLIILFFSKEKITAIINILYAIKLALCSSFFYIFLDNKSYDDIDNNHDNPNKNKKNIVIGGANYPKTKFGSILLNIDLIKILFCVSFSLSQFFVSEGLNISYIGSISLLPLIATGIDRLLSDKKPILYITTISLSILFNVYISLINLFFIFIYFLIESTSTKNKPNFFKHLNIYFKSTILSILLCSFSIIPTINNYDFRNDISLNFVRPKLLLNPWNAISQLMFHASPSSLNIYDSGVDLYWGILGLVLFITFFVNSKVDIGQRIKYLLFVSFLFSGIFFSTTNYLLNGNKGYYTNTFTFGYILTFTVMYISYINLFYIKGINKAGFTIITIILLSLIIITMKKAEILDSIKPLFYSLEFIFFYYLIILVYRDDSMNKLFFSIVLSLLALFEIITTYNINLSRLGVVAYTRPTADSTAYKMYETTNYIKNNNSNTNVLYFDDPNTDKDPFSTSLSGYDYVITSEVNDTPDNMLDFVETYKTEGMHLGMSIYKNNAVVHSAILPNEIISYKYDPENPFISSNIFSNNYLNCGDIYDIIDGETNASPTSLLNLVNFEFRPYEQGDAYSKAYHIQHIGSNNNTEPFVVSQNKPIDRFNNYNYQYAIFNKDNFSKMISALTTSTNNEKIIPYNQTTINSNINGYLYVPIKNTSNMNVIVNGAKVSTQSFICDMTLIPIKEGTNSIYIYYSNLYVIYGIIISILTILSVTFLSIINHKRLISKKEGIQDEN